MWRGVWPVFIPAIVERVVLTAISSINAESKNTKRRMEWRLYFVAAKRFFSSEVSTGSLKWAILRFI